MSHDQNTTNRMTSGVGTGSPTSERKRLFKWMFSVLSGVLNIPLFLMAGVLSSVQVQAQPETGLQSHQNTTGQLREVRRNDVRQGSLLFRSTSEGVWIDAPKVRTDVKMKVSGMVVRTTVTQVFTNTTGKWAEGVYVFPLPENSAVDHMHMQVGERLIEGVIKKRREARQVYERAKREGRKAALIEQQRPNLFTNSVANIGPGEKVLVKIEYQQTLRYDNGQFKLRFPMAITPRYIPGKPVVKKERSTSYGAGGWAKNTDQVPDAAKITPPVVVGARLNPVSIKIKLNAGFPLNMLKSSYHRIKQEDHGQHRYTITLNKGQVPANRDFELVWQPLIKNRPKAALFTETDGKHKYHLLMVMPPQVKTGQTARLAREVVFVIDTSGSMHGTSIQQARQALQMALKRLKPYDRFNVIQFNDQPSRLFRQARQATARNVAQASEFVSSLDASGGTEMALALKEALDPTYKNKLVRQVIFLTDGSVGNESALFQLIKQRLGSSRLFTVGIGSAPNSHFMSRAARFGRGTFTYIGSVHEVKDKMQNLFAKLETPVMTGLKVSLANTRNVEMYPKRIPDLYQGEPLVIKIKSAQAASYLTIVGQRGRSAWQKGMSLQGGQVKSGIGVLWARSKITSLMNSLHAGASKVLVRKAVTEIALEHHLVSKYTSLVAVDVTPDRPINQMLHTRRVPVNLPHGQKLRQMNMTLAQGATSAELHMITGLIGLFLMLLVIGIQRMRRDD